MQVTEYNKDLRNWYRCALFYEKWPLHLITTYSVIAISFKKSIFKYESLICCTKVKDLLHVLIHWPSECIFRPTFLSMYTVYYKWIKHNVNMFWKCQVKVRIDKKLLDIDFQFCWEMPIVAKCGF